MYTVIISNSVFKYVFVCICMTSKMLVHIFSRGYHLFKKTIFYILCIPEISSFSQIFADDLV